MLEGDYYPLTHYSRENTAWMAWQFNRPEKGDGVVQVFRRPESPFVRADFRLRGLDPAAIYEVWNFDVTGSIIISGGSTLLTTGKDLMEKGLPVELGNRPGSAVFTYKNGVKAVIAPDYVGGEQPLPVRFDGRGSSCSSGKIVSYEWEFGDGATSGEANPAYTYGKPGRYAAKLTVTDDQKRRDTASIAVHVTPEDTVAPTLASVIVPGCPDRVRMVFSEPVNQADAQTLSNYAITPGIRVLAAALDADRRTVTLMTSPLGAYSARGTDYTLSVKGIRDCGRRENVLASDTRQTFRFEPLFAHWPLDEGKGAMARDASGNNRNGRLVGGPAWTNLAGRAGLRFDGADDAVEMPTRLENLAVPFALAFWVNPADKQVEYAGILGNSEDTFGLVLQQDGNNTNRMFFGYPQPVGCKWSEKEDASRASPRNTTACATWL